VCDAPSREINFIAGWRFDFAYSGLNTKMKNFFCFSDQDKNSGESYNGNGCLAQD
jgi:hypothetical protein